VSGTARLHYSLNYSRYVSGSELESDWYEDDDQEKTEWENAARTAKMRSLGLHPDDKIAGNPKMIII
jgi:hypothetical protein